MSIFLWILQVVVALFCISGAAWRISNYEQASKDVASLAALSRSMWIGIGAFEIIFALLLILPRAFDFKPVLTPVAAVCLAVEMLFISLLHLKFFGLSFQASNPAVWTIVLSGISAFIAYGRFVLKP